MANVLIIFGCSIPPLGTIGFYSISESLHFPRLYDGRDGSRTGAILPRRAQQRMRLNQAIETAKLAQTAPKDEVGDNVRIAVIGSGGVGGYFGARLASSGADAAFLARGAHLSALRSQGIRVEGGPEPRFRAENYRRRTIAPL
jgi:hypothetical protein